MTAQSIVCGTCAAAVPYGRLSCPSCGELLASVAGSRRTAGRSGGRRAAVAGAMSATSAPVALEPATPEPVSATVAVEPAVTDVDDHPIAPRETPGSRLMPRLATPLDWQPQGRRCRTSSMSRPSPPPRQWSTVTCQRTRPVVISTTSCRGRSRPPSSPTMRPANRDRRMTTARPPGTRREHGDVRQRSGYIGRWDRVEADTVAPAGPSPPASCDARAPAAHAGTVIRRSGRLRPAAPDDGTPAGPPAPRAPGSGYADERRPT